MRQSRWGSAFPLCVHTRVIQAEVRQVTAFTAMKLPAGLMCSAATEKLDTSTVTCQENSGTQAGLCPAGRQYVQCGQAEEGVGPVPGGVEDPSLQKQQDPCSSCSPPRPTVRCTAPFECCGCGCSLAGKTHSPLEPRFNETVCLCVLYFFKMIDFFIKIYLFVGK